MKKKIDVDAIKELGIIVFFAMAILAALAYAVFRIWVFATYGSTPVTELPAWVWWVMQPAGGNT